MRTLLSPLFLLFPLCIYAQKGNIALTQRTGVNISTISSPDNSPFRFKSLASLSAGVGVEYYLLNKMSASAEVYYSQTGFKEMHETESYTAIIRNDFIDIPLVLRYYLWGDRLNILLGGQLGIRVGDPDTVYRTYNIFDRFNWGIPVGIGYNFKFGLLLEARYTQGLSNIFPESSHKTTSRSFLISCGYKFNLRK